MLTKTDLEKIGKLTRKIVREEVETEVRETAKNLQYEIKLIRMELSLRLDKVEDKLKDSNIRTTKVEASLVKLTKDVSKIKKDIKRLIDYHDEYYIRLRKRVEKIEDHLRM
jgi:hypothetical protein